MAKRRTYIRDGDGKFAITGHKVTSSSAKLAKARAEAGKRYSTRQAAVKKSNTTGQQPVHIYGLKVGGAPGAAANKGHKVTKSNGTNQYGLKMGK